MRRTQSWGAWDMLRRKILTPASINAAIIVGVPVAGPRVATILVFLMNRTVRGRLKSFAAMKSRIRMELGLARKQRRDILSSKKGKTFYGRRSKQIRGEHRRQILRG